MVHVYVYKYIVFYGSWQNFIIDSLQLHVLKFFSK